MFLNTSLAVSFQQIDRDLSAMTISTKLTRLDAKCFGAEVQSHFLRVVDVIACVTLTWHELGAELWKIYTSLLAGPW